MRPLTTDKLPAGSRPLYRILTKKSPMNFGKYADLLLSDVLKIDEDYIVYLYATMPTFSLHADILAELGLPKIAKPGADESVYKEWKKVRSQQYTDEQKRNGWLKIQRRNKGRAVAALCESKRATTYTKGQLQAINHGHLK